MATYMCRLLVSKASRSKLFVIGFRPIGTSQGRCCQAATGDQTDDDEERRYNEEEEQHVHNVKQKVLAASMKFVPVHGWSLDALSAGAEAEGMPGIAHGMFPRGGAELDSYFYQQCNKRLAGELEKYQQSVEKGETEKKKTDVFLCDAIKTRLEMNIPYIDHWPQAMALRVLPSNCKESWCNLASLVDEMWSHAGDQSHDMNWYTKRTSLAALYKSTEVHMIQDNSFGYDETWKFLSRRMDDVIATGKCLRKLQNSTGTLSQVCSAFSTISKNVLGIGDRRR